MEDQATTTSEQPHQYAESEIVERHVDRDGNEWVRVWARVVPGLQQLVWTVVKGPLAPKPATLANPL
jgi:hypothetical protein